MRTINEDDILKLRQDGNVKNSSGGNLKSVLPFAGKKQTAPKLTTEERTVKAIEEIVSKLAKALQDNDKNAIMLMDLIRKVIIKPDIKIPKFPEFPQPSKPIMEWNFEVERDRQGFIESIKARAE